MSSASGPRLCDKGCGRPAFGKFSSCCVKCTGDPSNNTHNRDCESKAKETQRRFEEREASNKKQKLSNAPAADPIVPAADPIVPAADPIAGGALPANYDPMADIEIVKDSLHMLVLSVPSDFHTMGTVVTPPV